GRLRGMIRGHCFSALLLRKNYIELTLSLRFIEGRVVLRKLVFRWREASNLSTTDLACQVCQGLRLTLQRRRPNNGAMHELQQKLLRLARQKNLGQYTLREIGAMLDERSPQKIKHHLN